MKRLTKNKDETKNWQYLTNGGQLVDKKLSQLEDIEEELGIDLLVLIKAIEQDTLFVKTPIGIKETAKNAKGWATKSLLKEDDDLVLLVCVIYPNDITHKEWLTTLRLKLSEYGKTWALDKQTLEKELEK